jgi:hypothetical protein
MCPKGVNTDMENLTNVKTVDTNPQEQKSMMPESSRQKEMIFVQDMTFLLIQFRAFIFRRWMY